jgi:endonuclease III
MSDDNIFKSAIGLANFIKMKNFMSTKQREPYYHMGATITDSILQAGMNYRHVVFPRILELLYEYPNYTTTCDFLILIQTIPLEKLINWKNERKLNSIEKLSWFLYENGIENENLLASWLNNHENIIQLSSIKGIGAKTIDYLKLLSGNQAIAIDRHLFKFLNMAGIDIHSYQEASEIYCKTAEILKISKYELDRQIWFYMSNTKENRDQEFNF